MPDIVSRIARACSVVCRQRSTRRHLRWNSFQSGCSGCMIELMNMAHLPWLKGGLAGGSRREGAALGELDQRDHTEEQHEIDERAPAGEEGEGTARDQAGVDTRAGVHGLSCVAGVRARSIGGNASKTT